MNNKIVFHNHLAILEIDTDNTAKTLSSLRDEDVDKAYLNKLINIYIDVVKRYPHSMDIAGKNFKDEELRKQILELIETEAKGVPLKTVHGILENIIKDYGQTKNEKNNINLILDLVKESYLALQTQASRNKFLAKNGKNLYSDSNLSDLIKSIYKDQSDFEPIDLKTVHSRKRKNSVAENVTLIDNIDCPEYTVDFSDENLTLFHLAEISFFNGTKEDNLNKYLLVIRDATSRKILYLTQFFGNLDLSLMNNFDYIYSLGLAIEQNSQEGNEPIYIGELEKGNKSYYSFRDFSQELASKEFERMERKKFLQNYRNDDAR